MVTVSKAILVCLVVLPAAIAAPAAHAGTWVVTTTSTNSESATSGVGNVVASGNSAKTTAIATVSLSGATSGSQAAEARAKYEGTWTFKWMPDNATDWPTAYTIKSVKQRSYQASVKSGAGTARVALFGGADLVNATLTGTAGVTRDFPDPATVVDNTVSNLTTTTTTLSYRVKRTASGVCSEGSTEMLVVERAYQAAWFTGSFANPSLVELTFSVSSSDLVASVDFDSTASGFVAAASLIATDLFTGE